MTYKSPIDIINEKVTESFENGVMKAVYKAEFLVDKYELYKALQYDRGQYEKGYADRDHEIVRCKDCRWGREVCGNIECWTDMNLPPEYHGYDWYCPNGERKEE